MFGQMDKTKTQSLPQHSAAETQKQLYLSPKRGQ